MTVLYLWWGYLNIEKQSLYWDRVLIMHWNFINLSYLYNENTSMYGKTVFILRWGPIIIMRIPICGKTVFILRWGPDSCRNFISAISPGWMQVQRCTDSQMGVTKPIFPVMLFYYFFRIIETLFTCWISHYYLTEVTADKLWWLLSNMNVIQRIWQLILQDWKFS